MEEEGEPSLSPNYTMPSEGSSNVSAGSTSRSRSRSHTSLSGAKPISAADLQRQAKNTWVTPATLSRLG